MKNKDTEIHRTYTMSKLYTELHDALHAGTLEDVVKRILTDIEWEVDSDTQDWSEIRKFLLQHDKGSRK